MMFANKESDILKDTIANMEAQLISLYEEKSTMAVQGNNQELIEMVSSLEEQLQSLYAEKEDATDSSDNHTQEMIRSLEEQVISLTNEKMELEQKMEQFEKEVDSMHTRTRSLGAAIFEAAVFGDRKDQAGKSK